MTTIRPGFDRGTIGIYPSLSTRPDEAYAEFIEDARNLLMHGQQVPIAEYSMKLLEENDSSLEPDVESVSAAKDILMKDPTLKTYYRIKRSLQESFWNRILRSYDMRREELIESLDEAEKKGPGTVSYDPGYQAPEYSTAEIHIQPGGYVNEPLAGYIYDYGMKVFLGGAGENDMLHKMIVNVAGAPEDGSVKRIADLGCSAGALSTSLKLKYPEAEVYGIDISAAMVRYAHKRAVEQGIDVNFKQMAAEDLDFPNDHFDMVAANLLFHELPVPVAKKALAEIFRVLRPGGVFTMFDFPGDRGHTVYSMFFAEMDAADNGEPYIPAFRRSNAEDLMEEAGFVLRDFDPKMIFQRGRVGVKPSE